MASPPPPPKPSRPVTLKLKTPTAATTAADANTSITSAPTVSTPSVMSPPPMTPGGGFKIILKRSQPPTPAISTTNDTTSFFPPTAPPPAPTAAPAPPASTSTPTSSTALPGTVTMTQKGRVSKPTAKKRAHDFDDSDDELGWARPSAATAAARGRRTAADAGGGPPKRPKLILKKSAALKARTASIVLKQIGKEAPPRSKGEGYDSEEDDREPDPLIEEEFVLRMLPGEHCDYLRRMIEERKIGVPVKDGGADFQMRWLAGTGSGAPGAPTTSGTTGSGGGPTGGERRALVTVRGQHFVGVLVDLPTITEAMKTWDKRNFMKSADVCQMLLVFAPVADEAEARAHPLPAMVTRDFRWPHGLTPPMHDCTHRRFRKRLSKKEIKDKEAELQRLLNEDRMATETKWELFDDGRAESDSEAEGDADADMEDADMFGDEDAYGEVDDEFYGQGGAAGAGAGAGAGAVVGDADAEGEVEEIDEAELMAEFMEEDDEEEEAKEGDGKAGETPAKAETPADEEDEDEDDEDDEDDMDEDEQARAEQAKGVREDINDLKKNLETLDSQLAATTNALLRKRIEGTRKRVLSELRLKQASIGEIDEE